ncbi:MAG TPA: lipase secretion chaperone [Spirochaetota bacterium]|nr:lipase secretion chaperone [Spirochaetota bacterium]HPC42872.1 lipase secretion chaperone [Spirochaetota bacterium]HPL16797.1 lipase secretion chaperone [Spirochaetota bacterium]HQF07144.1 lipase secretion chaperone [Spirochaetota bacterium]HQH95881.1 lipase secretion chaperone [Spirochaetota bacterium]
MNKKKLIAVAGMAVLAVIILTLALRKKGGEGFVIDQNQGIKLKDIELYYGRVDFNDTTVKEYFADSVINPYTLKFFMAMDEKFKDSRNLEEHLERARQYLYSALPQDEADKILSLYKVYMNYQISLADKTKEWGTPRTAEEAIALLHRLQDYRREVFGRENADALFGASVKAQEYPLRRGSIIADKDMYGAEKEKKIRELNRAMWGDEANSVEGYAKPYTRYQEKLKIYQKDLSEMKSDNERQTKIRQFRQELFTEDQVKRLDEVDRVIAEEQKKEDSYRAQEQRIKSDPNLDGDGKEQKIRELQERTFGDEAEAFRRRQAIERGLEQVGR